MNILLWVLQILLGLHTAVGAVWKFSHSEQSVSSLAALPHAAWLGLSLVELLCSVGLIGAALRVLAPWAPVAAAVIGAEMLLFCVVHLGSSSSEHGQLVYWLVVAAVCAFVAYGRWALRPLAPGVG